MYINGFENVNLLNRETNIGTRNEGGIAVFSKSNIADGVIIDKEIKHGILLVKLDKHFFSYH